MASIIKRGDKYAVVVNYTDEKGNRKQKWTTFVTKKEAKEYAARMDYAAGAGIPILFSGAKTVDELWDEYVRNYGLEKWSYSHFDAAKRLYDNYVAKYIGRMKLKDVTPRVIETYYHELLQREAMSSTKKRKVLITPATVKNIHKLLHSVFRQAERWELVVSNPFDKAMPPRVKEKKRDIWELDDLKKALNACTDPLLELCINLAFSCSLRLGEIMGLTWDCVHIDDDLIESNSAWILINKQLQRVSREAVDSILTEDVIVRFPSQNAGSSTVLVLKNPKTTSSIRKLYLPRTVAEMLKKRKATVEELKSYLGDDYQDYGMVICYENGTPMEGEKIRIAFEKLIKDNDLKRVVFHSLRHSSTTYKLKLSGGDIKAVQGDTGHAQASMITERYAHILDDDRRINAEKFEEMFYQGEDKETGGDNNAEIIALMKKLQDSPELLKLLKGLVK